MRKLLGVCLVFTLLLLAACGDGGAGQPAVSTPEVVVPTTEAAIDTATPTVGITTTEGITDGVGMTDTAGITGTDGMTPTGGITGAGTVTGTTGITGTEGMTSTGGVTGASAVTGTMGMTGTQGMTGTDGIAEAPHQLMRISDLRDYNVENAQGESLGSVQDLVFNLDTGQILLVTVEYGGFLGIGNKVFPIPLSAFRFEQGTTDTFGTAAPAAPGVVVTDTVGMTDTAGVTTGAGATGVLFADTRLILDIPEETFENAPGFENDFPVLTDSTTVGEIETFYRDLGEGVIGRPIATTDLDALSGRAVKMSDLDGGNVENPAGENVGEINDMLIDLRDGRVEHLILSFGGFLGIGSNQYAIPVDAFEVIPTSADVEAGSPELVLDITEEELEQAPVFDADFLNTPDWDLETRNYWLQNEPNR